MTTCPGRPMPPPGVRQARQDDQTLPVADPQRRRPRLARMLAHVEALEADIDVLSTRIAELTEPCRRSSNSLVGGAGVHVIPYRSFT
jgi:hypothetical protein